MATILGALSPGAVAISCNELKNLPKKIPKFESWGSKISSSSDSLFKRASLDSKLALALRVLSTT